MGYYYGFLKNRIMLDSSSGGIALALYQDFLKNGGIVYGVAWNDDYSGAHYERLTQDNEKDLLRLQGSKYIKADLNLENGKNVYESIINDLRNGDRVVFIGLPCEVYILSCLTKKKKLCSDNLLTVDLICHGPTKPEILAQFVNDLRKRYKSDVKKLSLRYKNLRWDDAFVYCEFENNKQYLKRLHETDFGIAFDIIGYESCYACGFRGENHNADITIGDYWGASEELRTRYPKGLSVLISRTENGERAISMLSNVSLFSIETEEEAIKGNPYYFEQRMRDSRCDKFSETLEKKGLHKACLRTLSIKQIVKYYHPYIYNVLIMIKKGIKKIRK